MARNNFHYPGLIELLRYTSLWGLLDLISENEGEESSKNHQREALFYEKLDGDTVRCKICFRKCEVKDGSQGYCRNRKNEHGVFYSLTYGKPSALQVEPVEKEPQYHFLPGRKIMGLGTAGCNFRCRFCHNWHLSQSSIKEVADYYRLPPEKAVRKALDNGIPIISFTYNEPTTFYEYVYEVAKIAREAGIKIIFHSNGAMAPEPLEALLKYVDSVTVDLKSINEKFYEQYSQGRLESVLDTLKTIKDKGVWLELVNLVIPSLNDHPEEIKRLCRFVADSLGKETPLHFTRFFPANRLQELSPTPIKTLEKAYRIAREEGLLFVYLGNVPGHPQNSTYCPHCEKVLIRRHHFTVGAVNIEEGRCQFCGTMIPGKWA